MGRMRSFALVESKSPQMSSTLAVENNGLSPSLRRGTREGDFRDLYILFVSAVLWAGCEHTRSERVGRSITRNRTDKTQAGSSLKGKSKCFI